MQYRKLGKSHIEISAVLYGGWQAGKMMWVGIDDDEQIRAHRAAFDAGVTTFDTAERYGEGHSERILAAAMGNRRDEIVIADKVFPTNLAYDKVIAACEGSLQRLETDRIDLYQIHWPAGNFNSDIIPISETMDALNKLKEQGKIRAIGVSNFSLAQLKEAQQYGRIDSVQSPYSLFWRHIEMSLMSYCEAQKITILAYSPLAQGLLSGKFGPDLKLEEGDHRRHNKLFQGENYKRVQIALDKLRPFADIYGMSLSQLALAWLIAQPQTCAVAGVRNEAQATDNAGSADIELDEDDMEAIDEIGHIVTDRLDDDNPVQWNW